MYPHSIVVTLETVRWNEVSHIMVPCCVRETIPCTHLLSAKMCLLNSRTLHLHFLISHAISLFLTPFPYTVSFLYTDTSTSQKVSKWLMVESAFRNLFERWLNTTHCYNLLLVYYLVAGVGYGAQCQWSFLWEQICQTAQNNFVTEKSSSCLIDQRWSRLALVIKH